MEAVLFFAFLLAVVIGYYFYSNLNKPPAQRGRDDLVRIEVPEGIDPAAARAEIVAAEQLFLEQFKAEIDYSFHSRVAGTSFKTKDGHSRQAVLKHLKPMDILLLSREPNNKYDDNAVLVLTAEAKDIGHLPREIAAEIAPELDSGKLWIAAISGVGRPSGVSRTGASLLLMRLSEAGIKRWFPDGELREICRGDAEVTT